MNLMEVEDLLNEASAFDGRQVTEEVTTAWHRMLRPLDAAQAMEAMRNHFASEDRRLMPVHVVQGVKKIRAELMGGFQGPGLSPEIPAANPDDVMAYLREGLAVRARSGDGLERRSVAELLPAVGRMPGHIMIRETTAMVVQCPEPLCRAVIGRQCQTPKGATRAPHEGRVDRFSEWKARRDTE